MYTPPRFIERAAEYLNIPIDMAALDAARSVSINRARRFSRRLSSSPARTLVRLANHAARHGGYIRQFIDAINRLDAAQWSIVDHPMKVPPDVVGEIDRICRRCKCVSMIARDVANVPSPAFNSCAGEVSSEVNAAAYQMLVELSRLPLRAVEIAVQLQESSGKDGG